MVGMLFSDRYTRRDKIEIASLIQMAHTLSKSLISRPLSVI